MNRDSLQKWLRAGLLTAVIDGAFSSVLSVVFYNSTVARLWQRVAAALLGQSAYQGGTRTALIGVAIHVGVAFAWSAVFLFLVMRADAVQRLISTRAGVIKAAAAYGPCVWLVMSLIVIPSLYRTAPAITVRWWVQLIGHFPFVGLPIVASIAPRRRPQPSGAAVVSAPA